MVSRLTPATCVPFFAAGRIIRLRDLAPKILFFTIAAPMSFFHFAAHVQLGETCSNGLPGIDGSTEAGVSVCCPIACGSCGSALCSSSDPPDTSCCPDHIVDSDQGDCADTGAAPCVISGEGTRRADSELKLW